MTQELINGMGLNNGFNGSKQNVILNLRVSNIFLSL
jgi:hypothetical protein